MTAMTPSSNRQADNIAISVNKLSKRFMIYDRPSDRLKQYIALQCQGLIGRQSKSYGREFWALQDVSFDIRRGETVGIIGKNGAGKSTLLQIICGTQIPTIGRVITQGVITALLELGSGFNPAFTGRENIFLNGLILGLTYPEIEARLDEIIEFADIGDFIEQPVNTYSSGMYVRLAFAVQVCVDPDILIVDEALAVGDAYFVHRCFQRIRKMKQNGKTILFVSHDTGSVVSLCDRTLWIDQGRLRMNGMPDEVARAYRADLFDIRTTAHSPENHSQEASIPVDGGADLLINHPEMHIPNILGRIGDQQCSFVGVNIYNPDSKEAIREIQSGESLLLRVSAANKSLMASTSLVVGYALRSPKGEEISSVNTHMEEIAVSAPEKGSTVTVSALITLPMLHPGNYALSVGIASMEDDAVKIQDRIENAIVFQVVGIREIVGMIRMPTHFTVELGMDGDNE